MLIRLTLVIASTLLVCSRGQAEPVSYANQVRPILSENCFYCHGQDANKRMADLQLNTLEGQRDSGVIEPGQPDDSELIRRIYSNDPDEQMPPANSNRSLSAEQKELLSQWIRQGSPFEEHWAYRPLVRPDVPQVADASRVENPIDAFVQSKLQQQGLTPSDRAAKETLIRRVTLDLIGLPPTLEEVDAFLADDSPTAYESLVDRLLASPHYGERMALPWLDAARYADSNGFQQDGDTYQWYWRDWVVRALNDNMPFDRFTIEQLAGDLLPNATRDQQVATAFLRNHMLNGEGGAIPEEQRFVILVDRVNTIATNWLGLTMACAQCHDHKYDPLTMNDFYSLMDALDNIPETGVVSGGPSSKRIAEPFLKMVTDEQLQQIADLESQLKALREQNSDLDAAVHTFTWDWIAQVAADEKYPDQGVRDLAVRAMRQPDKKVDGRLHRHFADEVAPQHTDNVAAQFVTFQRQLEKLKNDDYPRVMVMEESKPRETHMHTRGNYAAIGEKVSFHTPQFLPKLTDDAPPNRLGLARWIVSADNPLTARVIVNRQWQLFFGTGLVKTSEDFGVQSESPLHQELLNWLACELRDSGWDMKALQRLIVTSHTYRQTSSATAELNARDPENRLYARATRFRLPAMLLRDQALAASGLINLDVGGEPVYPYQQPDVWEPINISKERVFEYAQSTGADLYRRSLYTFWRRTIAPDNMFDTARRSECQVRVARTNTPLHALTTLNDPTYVEAARRLAQRVMQSNPSDRAAQVALAFRTLTCRPPTEVELEQLQTAQAQYLANFKQHPDDAAALLAVGASDRDSSLDAAEHAAMTVTCLALFNLDEVLTRE